MSDRLALGLCFILNLTAFAHGTASASPLEKSEITIKTYNYAGVGTETLEQAFSVAARVFTKAEVATIWLSCPLPGDPNRNPACEGTNHPTVLMLKILPRSMTARFSMPEGVFGFAALSPDGQPACLAYVFHDRVADLASAHGHSLAVILGHVLTHEVGHLLLGSNAHCSNGIMTGDWYRRNLHSAAQGQMLFTALQSARMRQQVAARQRDSHTTHIVPRPPGS